MLIVVLGLALLVPTYKDSHGKKTVRQYFGLLALIIYQWLAAVIINNGLKLH